MAGRDELARSFGAVAQLYEQVRPSYPLPAVARLLPAGAERVLDVGAGTGKLTALLAGLGLAVVAVEPDELMRRLLRDRLPGVETRAGRGEALPVGDGSQDAVFYAQSWHWVDPIAASAEAARVLRAGGVLAMLWNASDDRVPWVDRLREVTKSEARLSRFAQPEPLAGFCSGHRADFPSTHRLARADLSRLAATWSSVSTLEEKERDQVLAEVETLISSEPSLEGLATIELPQLCVTFSYHRLD